MTLRYTTLAALAAGVLLVSACDRSDDDDTEPMTNGNGNGNGNGSGEGNGSASAFRSSGNFAVIAGQGPTDEPYAFDPDALATDLATRFGGAADEPLDIDDIEDAVTVANRNR